MPIINYPERIFRTTVPAIDVVTGLRTEPIAWKYDQSIHDTPISQTFGCTSNYTVNFINFAFGSVVARDFYVYIANGMRVLDKYNDFLWFQCTGTLKEKITLTAGWYTGAQLATQLQTQLNSNTAFTAAGLTFTVTYAPMTGIFTITPSAGQIKYWQTNNSQYLGQRDSIAGHLFGLTANSAFGATVSSDTPVYGLDYHSAIISQAANTARYYSYTTPITLTFDQTLYFSTNTAFETYVDITLTYEKL